jgi:hypothetical protein
MLLDQFLPRYDVHEVHHIIINAPAERIYEVMKAVTFDDLSPIVRALFAIRGLPARLSGRPGQPIPRKPILEALGSFVVLADQPPGEFVFGTAGQFWRAVDTQAPKLDSAEAFMRYDQAGNAKAAANFCLQPLPDGRVKLTTETRVLSLDDATRRKFRRYWALIYPGSALIRVLWLRAIRHRAEQPHL